MNRNAVKSTSTSYITLKWPDGVSIPERGATYIIRSVTKALGRDVSSMTLSRNSVRRSRYRNREKQATVEQEFIRSTPLLLHWDGKLLPDISGNKETVDRIAVWLQVVGKKCYCIVPKIGRGTGKQQVDACLTPLTEWNIRQRIRGMVFDTTASNTGLENGACTFN